jgi:hypothetical protein
MERYLTLKQLREKRGNKRPIITHKEVSKEHIQRILNEALEKYYMVSTPIIEVPDKVIKIDNKGDPKLLDTLTKAGNLKKVDGQNVIKLEPAKELNIKTKGKKYNEVDKDSNLFKSNPHIKNLQEDIQNLESKFLDEKDGEEKKNLIKSIKANKQTIKKMIYDSQNDDKKEEPDVKPDSTTIKTRPKK